MARIVDLNSWKWILGVSQPSRNRGPVCNAACQAQGGPSLEGLCGVDGRTCRHPRVSGIVPDFLPLAKPCSKAVRDSLTNLSARQICQASLLKDVVEVF